MDFYLGIDIGASRVKAVFDQHFCARQRHQKNTSPPVGPVATRNRMLTQLAFGTGYSA